VQKAHEIKGPKFINVIAPAPWMAFKTNDAIQLSRLAVNTCYWPLYEIEDGVTKITVMRKRRSLCRVYETQGRFKHLSARRTRDCFSGSRMKLTRNGHNCSKKQKTDC